MPTWLVENPTPVYMILGLIALVLAYLWSNERDKKYAIGLAIVLAAIVLVMLVSRFVVTDHERVVLAVQEMAASVKKKDVDRIFSLISDKFDVRGVSKKQFRSRVESRIQRADVTELKVWDFERPKTPPPAGKMAVWFLVKAQGEAVPGESFFRCEAFFVKDPDGQWRLSGFRLMDPQKDPTKADDLPLPLN